MPTDPARVKRDDPGDPKNVRYGPCIKYIVQSRPLTGLKRVCTAQLAALECKKPLIESILSEQKDFKEKAKPYEEDIGVVKNIVSDGCEKARELAKNTMRDVRECMGLDYT